MRKSILAKNGIGQLLMTTDMGDTVADDASVELDTPKKAKKAVKAEAAKEKLN